MSRGVGVCEPPRKRHTRDRVDRSRSATLPTEAEERSTSSTATSWSPGQTRALPRTHTRTHAHTHARAPPPKSQPMLHPCIQTNACVTNWGTKGDVGKQGGSLLAGMAHPLPRKTSARFSRRLQPQQQPQQPPPRKQGAMTDDHTLMQLLSLRNMLCRVQNEQYHNPPSCTGARPALGRGGKAWGSRFLRLPLPSLPALCTLTLRSQRPSQ